MATIDAGDTKFANTEIEGRGYGVVLASIICPALALIFVSLRWYVRIGITKNLRFDDWFALITLVSNIGYSVLQGLATQPYIGIGNHQDDFDHTQKDSEYYKWVYMFDALYISSLLSYKTTILLLYIRVFGIRRSFKWWCFAALFIVDGYLFASLIVQLLGCIPPGKFWNKSIQGDCIDFLRFDIAYGCLNIITDFMITILPLREIWRLFMPIKEKVWASMIFGSAFLAFGAAIVSQYFRLQDLFAEDRTYGAAVTFVWQTIEINTGLMCSCTPTLRPLWQKTLETLHGTSKTSDSSQTILPRKSMEKDGAGKPLDGDTLNETSPDSTRRHDLEKGGDPNSNIGIAIGGGAIGGGVPRARIVHSDVYATPLPSDQEPYYRPATAATVNTTNTANTDQLGDLPVESAEDRGRPQQRPEKKRLSQAELERMVREANVAKEQLEKQAERSRQRNTSEVEADAHASAQDSLFSVPLPMLQNIPDPVSPVPSSSDLEVAPEVTPEVEAETVSELSSEPARKSSKKKKSCDLEKGVGLRI